VDGTHVLHLHGRDVVSSALRRVPRPLLPGRALFSPAGGMATLAWPCFAWWVSPPTAPCRVCHGRSCPAVCFSRRVPRPACPAVRCSVRRVAWPRLRGHVLRGGYPHPPRRAACATAGLARPCVFHSGGWHGHACVAMFCVVGIPTHRAVPHVPRPACPAVCFSRRVPRPVLPGRALFSRVPRPVLSGRALFSRVPRPVLSGRALFGPCATAGPVPHSAFERAVAVHFPTFLHVLPLDAHGIGDYSTHDRKAFQTCGLAELGVASPELPRPKPNGKGR